MFLREKDFKLLEFLREKSLKRTARLCQEPKQAVKKVRERPVERRTEDGQRHDKVAFEYNSSEYWKGRETEHWRWIRVYENWKERFRDERIGNQERMAENYIQHHHIDRMLIRYNY